MSGGSTIGAVGGSGRRRGRLLSTVGVGAAVSMAATMAVEVAGPTGPASWQVQPAAAQGCSGPCYPTGPYPDAVFADNPEDWLPLDDANGSTSIATFSAYGASWLPTDTEFYLCNGASPACPLPGAITSAGSALFNGTDSEITFPDNGDEGGSFTTEGWFETSAASGTEYVATVQNSQSGIGVTDGKVFASIDEGSDGTTMQTLTSSRPVNDGNWHYEAVTYNESTSTLSLYVDGILSVQEQADAAPYFPSDQSGAIGDGVSSSTSGDWFSGNHNQCSCEVFSKGETSDAMS